MKYNFPKKNIADNEYFNGSKISKFWDLTDDWRHNIYYILKNHEPISIKSLQNSDNYLVEKEDLYNFLLLSLYHEIPHQMGVIYIIKNNQEIKNKFETDKSSLITNLNQVFDLGIEWNKALDQGIINSNNARYNFSHLLKTIQCFIPDILHNYEFENFEYIENTPMEQNPLFGKKINSKTMIRDLAIRYLDFLLRGLKIPFKSNYERHKYIYELISLIFKNDKYQIFYLMNNIEITDIKKYLNYDWHNTVIKYNNIIFETFQMFDPLMHLHDWTNNRPNDNFYKKYGWISLPIIFPYIQKMIDTNITWNKLNSFYDFCFQYTEDFYTKEENN